MRAANLVQYAAVLLAVCLLVKPLGSYMARAFERSKIFLDLLLRSIERCIYCLSGVDAQAEMDWKRYSLSFVLFSLARTLLLYVVLRLQFLLPWYDKTNLTTPVTPDLAMDTAFSFTTTSTWQAYGGELTISYFSQIVGLTKQNFLTGAMGLALALAGSFARQGRRPATAATLPTDSLEFASIVIGTAIIVVGLSFLPALALGPIIEHLKMTRSG